MSDVNADEIARMRKVCEHADPGPWSTSQYLDGTHTIVNEEMEVVLGTMAFQENCDFVSAARTDMPRLLDALERVQSDLADRDREVERLKRLINSTQLRTRRTPMPSKWPFL